MLSIQSLKAYVDVINNLDADYKLLTGQLNIANWRTGFSEEKQVELLNLLFSFIDKNDNTNGSECRNIIHQFVFHLENCQIPLQEVMGTEWSEPGSNKPASLAMRDHLWSRFRLLLCSTIKDAYCLLWENKANLCSDYHYWQIMANVRWSASIIGSHEEVMKLYKLARKNHFQQEIIDSQRDPIKFNDLALAVGEFHDCTNWLISVLKSDRRVLSAVISPSFPVLNSMAAIYFDILSQQLESTILSARNAPRPWEATRNSSRVNTGSLRTKTDSTSYRGYCTEPKDTDPSLVSEDSVHQPPDTLDRNSIDLLLLIAKDCSKVDEVVWQLLDSQDARYHYNNTKETNSDVSYHCSLRWRWQSSFVSFIGDLIPALNLAICFDCSAAMDEEWERMQSDESLPTVAPPGNLLLESVNLLSSALRRFSVLLFPDDKFLRPVQTAFSLCARQQCIEMVNHALKLARHVSSRALSIAPAYVVLHSIFHLQGCVRKLSSQERELWSAVDDLDNVAKVLLDQITSYHENALSTSILLDAESNDWAHAKPFFENERCSLHVQAWYNHLSALKYDLWQLAGDGELEAQSKIQTVFKDVLERSLEILAARYCGVSPSSVRVVHMQCDVVAILACTSELLLAASKDVAAYLGIGENGVRQAKIHSHCSALFSAMVVVASPLKKLYKLCKKEFENCDSNDLAWLSLIRPSIWKLSDQSATSPATHILVHLKIFLEQPVTDYGALLEVLVARDTILAKLVMAHPVVAACYDSRIVHDINEPWDNHQFCLASPKNKCSLDCPQTTLSSVPNGGDCLMSILYVLAQTSSAPECFAEVFLHIFGRDLDVYEFEVQAEITLWLRVLEQVLEPLLVNLGEIFTIPLLMRVVSNESVVTDVLSLANEILPAPVPTVGNANLFSLISDAALQMLNAIPLMLFKIPLPVCILLAEADESQMSKIKYWSFKIIMAALNKFLDETIPETSCIDDNTFELITQALSYLCNSHCDSAVLKTFLSRMDSQIISVGHTVNAFFASCKKSSKMSALRWTPGCGGIASADFSQLVRSERGLSSLQIIHWFLCNHLKWLENRLCINDEPSMCLSEKERQSKDGGYNPFLNLDNIGNTGLSFQQSSLERVVNWDVVLEGNLPKIKLAFSNLLSHRWEFQEDARLDEIQRKYVSNLRHKYCLESSN